MDFFNELISAVKTVLLNILSTEIKPYVVKYYKSFRLTPLYADLGKGFHLVMGTYLPIGLEFASRVLLPICLTAVWAAECLEKTIASNSAELGFYRSIPYLILALGISAIIHVLYTKK